MGCEVVKDVTRAHNDAHADLHESGRRDAGDVGAYCKPRLRHLGAWNVFTRNGSGGQGDAGMDGFSQFDLGR